MEVRPQHNKHVTAMFYHILQVFVCNRTYCDGNLKPTQLLNVQMPGVCLTVVWVNVTFSIFYILLHENKVVNSFLLSKVTWTSLLIIILFTFLLLPFSYADSMESLMKSLALQHMPTNMQNIDRKKAGTAYRLITCYFCMKYHSILISSCIVLFFFSFFFSSPQAKHRQICVS